MSTQRPRANLLRAKIRELLKTIQEYEFETSFHGDCWGAHYDGVRTESDFVQSASADCCRRLKTLAESITPAIKDRDERMTVARLVEYAASARINDFGKIADDVRVILGELMGPNPESSPQELIYDLWQGFKPKGTRKLFGDFQHEIAKWPKPLRDYIDNEYAAHPETN